METEEGRDPITIPLQSHESMKGNHHMQWSSSRTALSRGAVCAAGNDLHCPVHMVDISQMWPLSPGNAASATEKLNFNFHLIVFN